MNTLSELSLEEAYDKIIIKKLEAERDRLKEENAALRTELMVNRKPDTKADYQEAKADAGKPRLTLVPPRIIWDIAAVRQYGVEVKYPKTGVDGWRTISMERIKDAAFRHFMRYLATPHGVDEESGLPHLWHCCCNLAFLCELEEGLHDKEKNL